MRGYHNHLPQGRELRAVVNKNQSVRVQVRVNGSTTSVHYLGLLDY